MEKIIFDYAKLKGKVKEKFQNQKDFSKAMGMSPEIFSRKINNKNEFTQSEIERACTLLEVSKYEIPVYFFTLKKSDLKNT